MEIPLSLPPGALRPFVRPQRPSPRLATAGNGFSPT